MRNICDNFFVSADANSNTELPVKGIDGKNLWVDIDFHKYHRAVQKVTITSIPLGFSERYRYDIHLEVGDTMYVHHFVVQPDNLYIVDGKEMYLCGYDQIFCVIRDGAIRPLEDWLFTVPVMEKEEDIRTKGGIYLKLDVEPVPNRATVKYANGGCIERGINEGDEIQYMTDANYEMEVEGQKLYRMKTGMIIAKYKDGDVEPFSDGFILEVKAQENETLHPSGLVLINLQAKREQFGTIYKVGSKCNIDYKVGDEYLYFSGQGTKVKVGEKYFLILRDRDLILDKRMYDELKSLAA